MEDLVHKGHRQRMRRKFSDFGGRVFDTYELLEMLLYNTVPVKDTNPISKRLLLRFGSLEGVFSATAEELSLVEGVGAKSAELILAAAGLLSVFSEEDKSESCSFDTYENIGKFFTDYFSGSDEQSVIMVSLDNSMNLLGLDVIGSVDYSSGGIKPAAFLKNAVGRGASVAIIAHNHPYGLAYPSEGDRQTNIYVESSLRAAGVMLAEHYIISGERYLGFMNHISTAFSQKPALERFFKSKEASFI